MIFNRYAIFNLVVAVLLAILAVIEEAKYGVAELHKPAELPLGADLGAIRRLERKGQRHAYNVCLVYVAIHVLFLPPKFGSDAKLLVLSLGGWILFWKWFETGKHTLRQKSATSEDAAHRQW